MGVRRLQQGVLWMNARGKLPCSRPTRTRDERAEALRDPLRAKRRMGAFAGVACDCKANLEDGGPALGSMTHSRWGLGVDCSS
jgi:hypothetical protein